ncbi:hypothetical protein L226DRAFT_521518 [Lentinus tigrinus ALCF2SS1-7]|uniref:Uncharacterized protein n=1 Tax=Lentinus tigrinus ALCF2SS1-6 TaxID=1328759 RepID=A0A5C2RQT1_9APHY|nr:hypothetical protein L227DRAFT_642468 [Lentinus tigrinus ALCF2SS1-6]RPD76776.1 hypothetical protein L226DRAFT_521518 [Lentinus tigrinus ALCF2SS1-7]
MADELRTRKRARLEEPDQELPQDDSEFWFEDGTIILHAHEDVRFCVYKGVLAEHSSVFADMFSFPQPPPTAAGGGIDVCQCPVVHLEDKVEDLRHVLRALFPNKHTLNVRTGPRELTYEVIAAYVRIGHKYQIDDLVQQSLDYLRQYYVADFDRWTSRVFTANRAPHGFQLDSWYFHRQHAIGIVNIARLTGCTSILPTALLCCCRLTTKELLKGVEVEDGIRELLEEEDVERCLEAKVMLMQKSTRMILQVFNDACLTKRRRCKTSRRCRIGIEVTFRSLEDDVDMIANDDPFFGASYFLEMGDTDDPICRFCRMALTDDLIEEQRKIWSQLPSILSLKIDGWAK